jgi:hypothetical protein
MTRKGNTDQPFGPGYNFASGRWGGLGVILMWICLWGGSLGVALLIRWAGGK